MKGVSFIFAIGGAAVGAVASYFITKNICDKEKEKDLNDIREMYEERIEKIVKTKELIKEQEKLKDELMKEIEKKDEEAKRESVEGTDYTSCFKAHKKDEKKEEIRFVTEAEAQKYSKDYELVGLTLYNDDVLIDDETENIIEDYEHLIGKVVFDNVRTMNAEEGIYILNPDRKAIYDITVIDERFNGDDYEPVHIE